MKQLQRFLTKLFRQVGGPHAAALAKLTEEGKMDQYNTVQVGDPRGYRLAEDYGRARLACDFVRKLRLPGDEPTRKANTIRKFYEAEAMCKITNQKFARYAKQLRNELWIEPEDMLWLDLLQAWRQEITELLGPLPLTLVPRFSGGSTVSDHGKQTTIPDKLSSRPTIYASSSDVYAHCTKGTPMGRSPVAPLEVRHNEFFTVPKDSAQHRGCCMEASGSLTLQLALGAHLKSRYKRHTGHDLRYAKPVHVAAAKQSSLDGALATIDLSMASDTIAKQLVKALLPWDWYALLESLRAPFTKINGRVVYLEKFSSMGNGYTFELETILFSSLCRVLTKGTVRTFGDDIIVDSRDADVILAALRWAGFKTNDKKTFCDGPFRESCGGDFFNGNPVRGHFLEEPPSEPQHWMKLANGLYRIGMGRTAPWYFCIDQVPVEWRVFGPSHLGDTVFRDDDAEPSWRPSATSHGLCEPFWTVWVPVSHTFSLERYFNDFIIIAAAAGLGVSPQVTVRNGVMGYRKRKVLAWGLPEVPRNFGGMAKRTV